MSTQEFYPEFKEGAILYSTWGYEQTNVDFYKIVERKPKSVVLQKIGNKVTEYYDNYGEAGKCVADEEHKIDKPFFRRITKSGYVNIDSVSYARLWDGKPVYWSSTH